MLRTLGALLPALVLIAMAGCGPDIAASTSESSAPRDMADASVQDDLASEEADLDRAERNEPETGRACGWICCTRQYMACNRSNASIDRDYIMEPCDLNFEICSDGLPL